MLLNSDPGRVMGMVLLYAEITNKVSMVQKVQPRVHIPVNGSISAMGKATLLGL